MVLIIICLKIKDEYTYICITVLNGTVMFGVPFKYTMFYIYICIRAESGWLWVRAFMPI